MAALEKLMCAEVRRQLGQRGATLQIPAGGDLLWQWFLDLSATRPYHMAGPGPITHAQIAEYGRATGWPIDGRHIAVLRAMDEVWMAHALRGGANAGHDGVRLTVSPTKITGGMFDAMFG